MRGGVHSAFPTEGEAERRRSYELLGSDYPKADETEEGVNYTCDRKKLVASSEEL